MYGYIYKTEILTTHEIYIGQKKSSKFISSYHGSGKQIKKAILQNDKKQIVTEFICAAESQSELDDLEIKYIQEYKKQYGDLCINIAKGGLGNNVLQYATPECKEHFIQKMTQINKERCGTENFKNKCSIRMTNLYADSSEREKQSIKIKKAWSDEDLRKEQSERLKEYYKTNKKDNSFFNKSVSMELNDETLIFVSRKELKKYLKDIYDVTLTNQTLKKLITTESPYIPFHKNKNNGKFTKLTGMILRDLSKV